LAGIPVPVRVKPTATAGMLVGEVMVTVLVGTVVDPEMLPR